MNEDEIHITVIVDNPDVESASLTMDIDESVSDFTQNYYYHA